MIKEIVRHIMVEVKPAPDIEIPDCVVGIDTHLSKIESFSFSDIHSEGVQMIGIYGVRFGEPERQSWPKKFITIINLILNIKALQRASNTGQKKIIK